MRTLNKDPIPTIFRKLQAAGCLQETDLQSTQDGFYLAYKSLAEMLAEKEIHDFPGTKGTRLLCKNFYDDWFLYAVPQRSDYVYSLFKLREQEHDAEDGAPADGDTPGVTISFISFDCDALLHCIAEPSDENRVRLDGEINRVVAYRGQRHDKALKGYFVNPKSEGSYLVAKTYVRHIASFAEGGCLNVPHHYKETFRQSQTAKHSAKKERLPRFIDALNEAAGYTVCDHEKIYIQNPADLNEQESLAILATHTGNTSVYSFAAEVEYHARFLIPIAKFKVLGRSVYESAIRADMSVGDAEFQGPASFYRPDSPIVMKQYHYHKDRCKL